MIETLRLQQCLLNLVFNALEAMPDGGGLSICSRRDPKTKQIEIEIADTGTGIPEEHQDKIFTPFFTTKPAGQGKGQSRIPRRRGGHHHRLRVDRESAVDAMKKGASD
jgi:signal transduction histidine kinase